MCYNSLKVRSAFKPLAFKCVNLHTPTSWQAASDGDRVCVTLQRPKTTLKRTYTCDELVPLEEGNHAACARVMGGGLGFARVVREAVERGISATIVAVGIVGCGGAHLGQCKLRPWLLNAPPGFIQFCIYSEKDGAL